MSYVTFGPRCSVKRLSMLLRVEPGDMDVLRHGRQRSIAENRYVGLQQAGNRLLGGEANIKNRKRREKL